MFSPAIIKRFNSIPTPFYYYNTDLLIKGLRSLKLAATKYKTEIHYALKANANKKILSYINSYGFGADCVSGNEIKRAISCGFHPSKIVFAGVGKTDKEIQYALQKKISCFNCESVEELGVIDTIAGKMKKKASVALRINPNVNAQTHSYITTGMEENKFGIAVDELENAIHLFSKFQHLQLMGVHFHIGSQVTEMDVFKDLCIKVNEILIWFRNRNIILSSLNLGGGLGIDYHSPDRNALPDFKNYISLFKKYLTLEQGQQLHLEPGRAITAQCGSLITRVLYVKEGVKTKFVILDAGMTELIRPALYQSFHKIENLTRRKKETQYKYDIVGPVCESSDCFGKNVELSETRRGDLIAIRSTGAYAESMTLDYNLRKRAKAYFSNEI